MERGNATECAVPSQHGALAAGVVQLPSPTFPMPPPTRGDVLSPNRHSHPRGLHNGEGGAYYHTCLGSPHPVVRKPYIPCVNRAAEERPDVTSGLYVYDRRNNAARRVRFAPVNIYARGNRSALLYWAIGVGGIDHFHSNDGEPGLTDELHVQRVARSAASLNCLTKIIV